MITVAVDPADRCGDPSWWRFDVTGENTWMILVKPTKVTIGRENRTIVLAGVGQNPSVVND
jgi:hypothetical protein